MILFNRRGLGKLIATKSAGRDCRLATSWLVTNPVYTISRAFGPGVSISRLAKVYMAGLLVVGTIVA